MKKFLAPLLCSGRLGNKGLLGHKWVFTAASSVGKPGKECAYSWIRAWCNFCEKTLGVHNLVTFHLADKLSGLVCAFGDGMWNSPSADVIHMQLVELHVLYTCTLTCSLKCFNLLEGAETKAGASPARVCCWSALAFIRGKVRPLGGTVLVLEAQMQVLLHLLGHLVFL